SRVERQRNGPCRRQSNSCASAAEKIILRGNSRKTAGHREMIRGPTCKKKSFPNKRKHKMAQPNAARRRTDQSRDAFEPRRLRGKGEDFHSHKKNLQFD